MRQSGIKIVTTNRKAHFNYFLSDFTECGIALKGTEIKSIRNNNVSINDAYVVIKDNQAFILNMHISSYKEGTIFNVDPMRTRTLLLHKKEIIRFGIKVNQGGYTLVPTKVYFKNGKCKVEIALAKGKKLYDKRDDIKNRDIRRDIDRNIKDFNN